MNKEYTTRGILHEIYLHNFTGNINGFGKKTVSYSLHVIGAMVKLSHGALCYRFGENENSTQKIFKITANCVEGTHDLILAKPLSIIWLRNLRMFVQFPEYSQFTQEMNFTLSYEKLIVACTSVG